MHEVDKWGIGRVVEMALDHVNPKRDLPVHLSFDVDALDPSVAPSTGTPVRGGLTFREGHYICEAVYETGCLVALDIMEVNPSLGTGEDAVKQTVAVGCSLARSALAMTEKALFSVELEATNASFWLDSVYAVRMTYEAIEARRRAKPATVGAPLHVKSEQSRLDSLSPNGLSGYDARRVAGEQLIEMFIGSCDESTEMLLEPASVRRPEVSKVDRQKVQFQRTVRAGLEHIDGRRWKAGAPDGSDAGDQSIAGYTSTHTR
ncbi:hypothetical protein EVJ58_g7481 [Rhodofomes roseus]|uniref:Arginase n=1 Tax=Rhodofomes roseus TaxID=34475 RepID=A0A4Y9Y3L1_9APHY|nr:hypothetical protein EVJ58_g7481 [Rhodofomes roseus]